MTIMDAVVKICKVCGKMLSENDFYGKIYTCKRCICARNTQRTIAHNFIPDIPGEVWTDVVGFEGYYVVSSKGRVKAIGKRSRYRVLTASIHRQGYERVKLSVDKFNKTYLVHRLVAEAFIRNPNNKATVNHLDGIKNNNCVWNLEWATQQENNQHAHSTGLSKTTITQIKAMCLRAKITKEQILEIQELYKQGRSQLDLSLLYDISKAQICRIVNGKSRQSTLMYL